MNTTVYTLDQFKTLVSSLNEASSNVGRIIFNGTSEKTRLVINPEETGRFTFKKSVSIDPYLLFDEQSNVSIAEYPNQLTFKTMNGESVITFNSNDVSISNLLTETINGVTPTFSQWVTNSSNIYYSNGSNSSNVGIGTSNPQYKLHVVGDVFATSTVTFSDQRYKTDVVPIVNGLDKVLALRGYTYRFIEDGEQGKKHAGVMAQEVEQVLPEVINKSNDGRLSVAYVNMAALFIEAIHDLKNEIDELKKQYKDNK
jgi:hypothetical protein